MPDSPAALLEEPATPPKSWCGNCSLRTANIELRSKLGLLRSLYKREKEKEEELKKKIEELESKLRLRERQLFGKRSERAQYRQLEEKDQDRNNIDKRKSRGRQKGDPGHGRKLRDNLPVVEEIYDLPEDQKCCTECGLPKEEFLKTEDSEIIEIEIKAHRRKIRRKRYIQTCQCRCYPKIITAPGPHKLIPKGIFGISFWVEVILEKYLWQRPMNRVIQKMGTYGLTVSAGTVTGGLQYLSGLFEHIEKAIIERNRKEHHWHADETRWMVFVEMPGKAGYRWYLWLFQSDTTVVFKLAPSRGAKVPEEHFGEKASGIINADRYRVYKKLIKSGRFLIAFCWAHVRRDFIALAKDWPKLENWAILWVERIRTLYHLNKQRLQFEIRSKEFKLADKKLRKTINEIKKEYNKQLKQDNLDPANRKLLESLERHWSGLILFVDYPLDSDG